MSGRLHISAALDGGYVMCEDYPCCGHTPADPCGSAGATANDYLLAWSRHGRHDHYYEDY
jgi:hypothetical protein